MQQVQYHLTVKEMPPEVRPRERMFNEGPGILSDIELLAILIGTGTRSITALELSSFLINRFDGLAGLAGATLEELSSVKGVGPAKASHVMAALELAKRLTSFSVKDRPVIRSPEDVVNLVMGKLKYLDREHFQVLLLNTKHQLLYYETISIGTLNSSTVHPRELFKNAIKKSAAAIILLHNHPSGDPTPSREDIEVTRRLIDVGHLIGIEVLDHIIIGDNKFKSLKADGLFG